MVTGIGVMTPIGLGNDIGGSLRLPPRYNVDLRLSRQVPIGPTKAEVIAELKNVFNTVQWSGVDGTSFAVDPATGLPLGTLPTSADEAPLRPSGGYEQRQFQLGFRFIF